jgi:hypothetical protein
MTMHVQVGTFLLLDIHVGRANNPWVTNLTQRNKWMVEAVRIFRVCVFTNADEVERAHPESHCILNLHSRLYSIQNLQLSGVLLNLTVKQVLLIRIISGDTVLPVFAHDPAIGTIRCGASVMP